MARCGCGGASCGCTLIAGDNIAVSGTGSAANPYIVAAVTDCTEVRACLHAGDGLAFDMLTGTFSAALSPAAGNNLIINPDGGLFVPAGAATVTVGCGLSGDGSGSAPLLVSTATWPFPCSVDTAASGVYCDASGALRGDPPKQVGYVEAAAVVAFPNLVVPLANTVVTTNSTDLVNPDPCRPATAIVNTEVDVNFTLPAGAAAAYLIDGDEMWFVRNSGPGTDVNIHNQLTKTFRVTIPPGGTVSQLTTVGLVKGAGGATYNRVTWAIHVLIVT